MRDEFWPMLEVLRFVRRHMLPVQMTKDLDIYKAAEINALHAFGLTLAELERDIERGDARAIGLLEEIWGRSRRCGPQSTGSIVINRSDIRNALQSVVIYLEELQAWPLGKTLDPITSELSKGITRIRELVEAADA